LSRQGFFGFSGKWACAWRLNMSREKALPENHDAETLFYYYKNVYLCCCTVKNKHKNVILLLWRLFGLCFVLWFFIYKNKELSGFFLAFSLVGTLLD